MCPSSHMRLFPTITNQQTPSVSTKNQNTEYPLSAFTLMYTTPPTSSQQPQIYPTVPSASVSKVQKTFARLSEREINRKDKKKYLERLRRSKINSQIKMMYDLIFKMSGESIRKREICEMLADCLTVIESLFKIVMEDPLLKAKVLPPELLSSSKSSEINNRMQGSAFSPMREEEKENVPPNSNISSLSLISANSSSIQIISTPIECRMRKRERADSGLEQSHLSTSSSIPNSSSLSHESSPVKKSRKTPYLQIWRPYQE
ncbi:unnamed protein product [Hymenolepis diminuta]|uniref:BHLH domain-containing protein n=1 Tax=Hymenolepis diminuta TaxID=6216 RepID=A0A0R3SBY4_HYMDI|nr:unnamed protein product [Hymenolepis diminuta]VUZ56103.1 unnamed protein product [Hymenolepis diminuta]